MIVIVAMHPWQPEAKDAVAEAVVAALLPRPERARAQPRPCLVAGTRSGRRVYYSILYYTILYYTILYYTILYYTILYHTILYYTMRGREIRRRSLCPGGNSPLRKMSRLVIAFAITRLVDQLRRLLKPHLRDPLTLAETSCCVIRV